MSAEKKIRVGVLGASGYTGADLVRLLVAHPNVEIVLLTAERKAGLPISDVFPHLVGLDLPDLISINEIEWPAVELDVIFCALPHATSQEVIKGLLHATNHSLLDELIIETVGDQASAIKGDVKIVDLSADFRLRDVGTYAKWYVENIRLQLFRQEPCTACLKCTAKKSRRLTWWHAQVVIQTAALLALMPLLKADVISPNDIIIDAKSGVSGQGAL